MFVDGDSCPIEDVELMDLVESIRICVGDDVARAWLLDVIRDKVRAALWGEEAPQ